MSVKCYSGGVKCLILLVNDAISQSSVNVKATVADDSELKMLQSWCAWFNTARLR
jgi:hypothetical protein